MKLASDGFRQRLERRLRDRPDAMRALSEKFGLSSALMDRYRLGLSEPYPKASASPSVPIHQDVLVAPLRGEDGRFYNRYVYRVLPGITMDNRLHGQEAWSPGHAATYYSRKPTQDDSVLVCGSVTELWTLAGLIDGTGLHRELVLVASTHGTVEWPSEWTTSEFWSRWKTIYIGLRTAESRVAGGRTEVDGRAYDLARCTKRDVHRVPPPDALDWSAACVAGLRVEALRDLLRRSAKLSPQDLQAHDSTKYESAEGEDLSCAYHAGYLYETLKVLERQESSSSSLERYTVLVVRSDRTVHKIKEMPCDSHTPRKERVVRLVPDGCQLQRKPTPSPYCTWRWSSVQAFVHRNAQSAPLADLIATLNSHLRCCVWLPRSTDYCLLACAAASTYCQQVFDAVPLILVTGPRGSGKTELGIAMSQICANSPPPVGFVTAATLARLIDMTHGFVAIDDLEKVMAKRNGESQFSELAQAIKLSYKKLSARKFWTDTNDMRVEALNFFGMKLINNTGGVDEILGSRMLTVPTRVMPNSVQLPREGRLDRERCAQLRDQLHTWAFTHVSDIERAYAEIFPNPSTRPEEISAPLRVIARLSGSADVQEELDQALKSVANTATMTSRDLMEEAILYILTKSIKQEQRLRTTLTVQEVQMRMRLLEGTQFGKTSTTEISDIESPEWIGRQFSQVFSVSGTSPQRIQMYGRGIRAWSVDSSVLDRAIAASGTQRNALVDVDDPRAFCQSCQSCDYSGICSMEQRKTASTGTTLSSRGLDRRGPQAKSGAPSTGMH
jgi:hypothetical protein